jgi:predicted SprT family Zn-dependent metalloprotease
MNSLIEAAKENLGVRDNRATRVVYSRRFGAYNGNIRATREEIIVGLSADWQGRDPDIVQGLVEHLVRKLFKKKVKTQRMGLYQDFLLYVHREQREKTVEDARLKASFDRVNARYFGGAFEMPNLTWGQDSTRKLGHYHYGSDTVMLSTVLQEEERFLDYVMYHELLHKKHGMTRGGRAHTKAFRDDEARFVGADDKTLSEFVAAQRRSRGWSWRRWF